MKKKKKDKSNPTPSPPECSSRPQLNPSNLSDCSGALIKMLSRLSPTLGKAFGTIANNCMAELCLCYCPNLFFWTWLWIQFTGLNPRDGKQNLFHQMFSKSLKKKAFNFFLLDNFFSRSCFCTMSIPLKISTGSLILPPSIWSIYCTAVVLSFVTIERRPMLYKTLD